MHSRNPNVCPITSLTVTEFKEGYFVPLKLPSETEPVSVWERRINFKEIDTSLRNYDGTAHVFTYQTGGGVCVTVP